MDPQTALVIATLMMLLNGAVLGLMHRDLPESLRPSAVSWRIGTLLQAGGCVFLAVQRDLPPAIVLPLGNALLILGLTGYWRALRQFVGLPDSLWLLLPLLIGTGGIYWFATVTPSLTGRITMASLAWITVLLGAVLSLWHRSDAEPSMSRRVLSWIFIVVVLFMLIRIAYFNFVDDPAQSLLDSTNWMNIVTPMIAAIMPVIGTTAFLLLCSDRIRRQWEIAASTDYLTGLANRRTIASLGAQQFDRAHRQNAGLAVAIIDIDHFKSINDRFGHDVGDAALKHVAARIEAACRPPDVPGRQGGEEFVALFACSDHEQARGAAERLRRAVQSAPFATDDTTLTITVSVGVANLSTACVDKPKTALLAVT